MPGILESSEISRAVLLAERSAWSFTWTDPRTVGYFRWYRVVAETAFEGPLGVEHLKVGYIMLGLATFSGQWVWFGMR
jgi:hypothetical protein